MFDFSFAFEKNKTCSKFSKITSQVKQKSFNIASSFFTNFLTYISSIYSQFILFQMIITHLLVCYLLKILY